MAKVREYLFMITLHDTVVPPYLWKSDSRTACRYQNLRMLKSVIQNGVIIYIKPVQVLPYTLSYF